MRLFLFTVSFAFFWLSVAAQNNQVAKSLKDCSKREMLKILRDAKYGGWMGKEEEIGGFATVTLRKADEGSFSIPLDCEMVRWDVKRRRIMKMERVCITEPPPLECKDDCEYTRYDAGNPYKLKLFKTRLGFFIVLKANNKTIEEFHISSFEKYCCEFPHSVLTLVRVKRLNCEG